MTLEPILPGCKETVEDRDRKAEEVSLGAFSLGCGTTQRDENRRQKLARWGKVPKPSVL